MAISEFALKLLYRLHDQYLGTAVGFAGPNEITTYSIRRIEAERILAGNVTPEGIVLFKERAEARGLTIEQFAERVLTNSKNMVIAIGEFDKAFDRARSEIIENGAEVSSQITEIVNRHYQLALDMIGQLTG